MSRTGTHEVGATAIAIATQGQIEAAIAFINTRLSLGAELICARSLARGFRAAITYYAEGFGTEKLGSLECLSVTAAPSCASWGVLDCKPLLRRALKLQGVEFTGVAS